MIFSADETTDIGYEFRHDRPVRLRGAYESVHRASSTGFSSTPATDDHDHFIDPEKRLRVPMARQ